MEGLAHFWDQADGVGRFVALLLLLMSVTAWVVIVWKAWLLRRVGRDVARGSVAFMTPVSELAPGEAAAVYLIQSNGGQ